jgi:hypothetical protein
MKKYVVGFVLMALMRIGMAQQQENVKVSQHEKLLKLQGTYEVKSQARFVSLPSNLADIIAENRDATKRVTKTLSSETTLIIYPLSEIQSKEKAQEVK